MSRDVVVQGAKNLGRLLIGALPIAIVAGLLLNSFFATGWSLEHDWTLVEILSAMSFWYIMLFPFFVVSGFLQQLVLVAHATLTLAPQSRSVLVITSLVLVGPIISVPTDWEDRIAILAGLVWYALTVRPIQPRPAGTDGVGKAE